MIEKTHYGGTRGHLDVVGEKLSVVFDIGSPAIVYKIRKALGAWIPTSAKFYWETSNDMHVGSKGMYKDAFKYDGEYAVSFPKNALPEVLKAIGYHRSSAQVAQSLKNLVKPPRANENDAH